MTRNIIIRPAVIDDIDQVLSIELTTSRNPWTRAHFVDELSNPSAIFLVLDRTNLLEAAQTREIVGFACSTLVLDELQIGEVAVLRDHQCRGLGSTLIKNLLTMAANRGAARAFLEVRPSNLPAIRVYEKCGFTKNGVRKGYYQDGEDAVLMEACLRSPHGA